MDKLKVLNLYAGIGGNRKLWGDVEVTAVEHNEAIAAIYSDLYPQDKMIIGDAHAYLLEHFKEFDFIWGSPPCPTHSRFRLLWQSDNVEIGGKKTNASFKYPDMKLYEEIIFLTHFSKALFCIENVISYYEPLIKPQKCNSHYYWANFNIKRLPDTKRHIRHREQNPKLKDFKDSLKKYELGKRFEKKILNNCVEPETGLFILNCARGVIQSENVNQPQLF